MLYRTLIHALDEPTFASWKEKVIVKVTLKDGRTFFRTYVFDATRDKCRACRHSPRTGKSGRNRVAMTGATCQLCGNPFAAFTRQGVIRKGNTFTVNRGQYTDTGRLHGNAV